MGEASYDNVEYYFGVIVGTRLPWLALCDPELSTLGCHRIVVKRSLRLRELSVPTSVVEMLPSVHSTLKHKNSFAACNRLLGR